MKKIRTLLCLITLGLAATITANATTVTFSPTPTDLSDLPHANYFTWGINFTLPSDEKITGAVLTFANIWDWTAENNDHLYIHLLDNLASGVKVYTDNEGGGDNFSGQGTLVSSWSDPAGGYPRNYNLVIDFGTLGLLDTLNAYAKTTPGAGKVNFGFGIDPDCHYYNDGVTFTITTECTNHSVPEPATIVIFGIGGLLFYRKK